VRGKVFCICYCCIGRGVRKLRVWWGLSEEKSYIEIESKEEHWWSRGNWQKFQNKLRKPGSGSWASLILCLRLTACCITWLYMIILCLCLNFVFLKFFQKSPDGQWTATRRLMHFSSFCASTMNRLADDELPPGEAC